MRAGEFVSEVSSALVGRLAPQAGEKPGQAVGKQAQTPGTANQPVNKVVQPSTVQQDIKNLLTGKEKPVQPEPDQQIGQDPQDQNAQNQEEQEQVNQPAQVQVGKVLGPQVMAQTVGKPTKQINSLNAQQAKTGSPPPGSSFNYPGIPGNIKVLPRDSSTPDKEQGIQFQIPQLPGPLGKQKFSLQYKNLLDPARNPNIAQDLGTSKK